MSCLFAVLNVKCDTSCRYGIPLGLVALPTRDSPAVRAYGFSYAGVAYRRSNGFAVAA